MADNTETIKFLRNDIYKAIEDGVELYKYYKDISKNFQEQQKIIMNNQAYEKNLKKEINKISERRKEIIKRRQSKKLSDSDIKLSNSLNSELANKEKFLKSDEYRQKYKQDHNKLSEPILVNTEIQFLKEKEKLRKEKKRILSRIKIALATLKKLMFKNEFTDFIKYLNTVACGIVDNKEITFKKLMHHLESGEISNEVAKTTKKIDELMTVGNIANRKKKMEFGIKRKEIEKLFKESDKIMELSKKIAAAKFPAIVIDNKYIEKLLLKKNLVGFSPEFQKMIRKLRTLKFDIMKKMKELKKMEFGIKRKKIEKLFKESDKIMELSKKIAAAKFPDMVIDNKYIEDLLLKKKLVGFSPEFKKMIVKLRTLKFDIMKKMEELKELEKSL